VSRKLDAKRARREADERKRRARARAAGRQNSITVAIAVVVIGGVTALIILTRDAQTDRGLPQTSNAPEGVVSKTIEARNHVEGPVNYPDTPPMGGNHASVWQNCGLYNEPIIKEQGVHSLEHGAVWITYRPSLAAAEKDALEQLAEGEDFILVSPFEGLTSPIMATAWGRQLAVQSASDERLAPFASFFQVGPQTPEPGAPCSGGAT